MKKALLIFVTVVIALSLTGCNLVLKQLVKPGESTNETTSAQASSEETSSETVSEKEIEKPMFTINDLKTKLATIDAFGNFVAKDDILSFTIDREAFTATVKNDNIAVDNYFYTIVISIKDKTAKIENKITRANEDAANIVADAIIKVLK